MIPVLTILADVMGIGAGWFSMKLVLPITDADFAYGARSFWRSVRRRPTRSSRRSSSPAASRSSPATWGSTPSRARRAWARSTTGAVVSSSVLILAARRACSPSCCSTRSDDRAPRRAQAVRQAGRPRRRRLRRARGRDGGAAGPVRHRQERAAQAHHRPDPARTSGTIIVDDKDVGRLKRKELAELRSHIGYVFQNGALFDSMNVFENVRLGITDEDKYRDLEYCAGARGRVHQAGEPAARDDRQVPGRSSRAACGSGSGSRGPSRAAPSTCSTTSPPRGSTRSTPT